MCQALCWALGMEVMSQTAPYPEEELTVWWERRTRKQIMQCGVTRARMETHHAALREGGDERGGGEEGEAVPVSTSPILYSLLWGVTL